MNNEVYEIGQKLYVVGHRKLDLSEEIQEAIGEDETLWGPVLEEEEVRSITIKVSQTTAHDGSMTRKEERWHRLSSGVMIGPGNLVKREFLTITEAGNQMRDEFTKEIEDAQRDKLVAEARIKFFEAQIAKLEDGLIDVDRAADQ